MKITGHEKGFAFIEVMLAIAISGVIIGVIVMTISQAFTGSRSSNDQATVLNHVQNAGCWIVRDAQMSEYKHVNGDINFGNQDVVSFKWWDWSTGQKNLCKIDYKLKDNKLIRTFKRHEGEGEGTVVEQTETEVARYITEAGCPSNGDLELLTVTITGSIGEATLTEEYEANPRVTGLDNPWE